MAELLNSRAWGLQMKKLLVAGIAAAAFCGAPVLAADLPVKAPAYRPAPAPMFSWNGCYLGGHAGYGWGRNTNSFGDAIASGRTEGGGIETPEFGPYNQNVNGGVIGGQLGCNYQAANNWVAGIEGEIFWTGMKGSITTTEDLPPDPGSFSRFQTKNLWDGDIALRLGYAMDRSLLYGKVGVAWGRFNYTETHDDFPVDNACNSCSVSFADTRSGLLLGLGWEYALQNNWTFKLEYDYINFGSHNIPYPNASASIQSFPVHDTKNIVKVGFNYLFSTGKAPVVAKY